MGTTLNRQGYQKLVDEDLVWLKQQPRTLERDHIEMIVEQSPKVFYEDLAALKATIDAAWAMIVQSFEVEDRDYFEKKYPDGPPLAIAIHYIWKRDAKVEALKGQVADLTRQLEQRNETLDTANMALITAKRMHAETFEQLAEVEEAGDKLAEALKALPLAVFEKEMQSCDAAEFSDYAADFYDAMTKARPALFAWQKKRDAQ